MKVLVTGANGFIGSALCLHLSVKGHEVIPVAGKGHNASLGQIVPPKDNSECRLLLKGCDTVIHLAGRAHVMRDRDPDPLESFLAANLYPTVSLACRAIEAGVKRLIFISSIKVNGEETVLGSCFNPGDTPNPNDAYSVSKYKAEQELLALAEKNLLEVVIIRPCLVYGPGVKGNFATLLQLVKSGVPLPLSAIKNNLRSLVSLHNLIDLISVCMNHPGASNQIFLASDGEDLSTYSLLVRVYKTLSVTPRLFYVPPFVLKAGAILINKLDLYQRLCCSLQADVSKNQLLLDWTPPFSVDEGLRRSLQRL